MKWSRTSDPHLIPRVGRSVPWLQDLLRPLNFNTECYQVPNAKTKSHAMHAKKGFQHHLLVVGSGCDRVEGVVSKNNTIATSNHFLQQVSEESVASSGTEKPEETKFENCLCSLPE